MLLIESDSVENLQLQIAQSLQELNENGITSITLQVLAFSS